MGEAEELGTTEEIGAVLAGEAWASGGRDGYGRWWRLCQLQVCGAGSTFRCNMYGNGTPRRA